MPKKIRLIDDGEGTVTEATETTTTTAEGGSLSAEQVTQLMKYAEAIDWKLWEILKILRAQTEGK